MTCRRDVAHPRVHLASALAISHLQFRLARSKKVGHRLRLLALLAEIVPAAEFKHVVAFSEAEFVGA
jgi:hypothetical protein